MGVRLDIGSDVPEKVAVSIKNLNENISLSDIVEIVFRNPASEKIKGQSPSKEQKVTMTSREIADALDRPHATVIKQIAKFLCETEKDGKESGYILTSFVSSHKAKKSYPMYELTEGACLEYKDLVKDCGNGKKSVMDGIKRFEKAIEERFHPETRMSVNSDFLLEGKSRSEYEKYCDIFNQFICGPGIEGREIKELTEGYQEFYKIMESTQLGTQESNKLENALYGVAIEAEMQGFIYGFKLFDALLGRQSDVVL